MRKPNVDLIALVLALTLGVSLLLVLAAVIIQIFVASNNPVLSAAPSQVIDSALTGVIGVLGSYVGYSMKRKHDEDSTGQDDGEDRQD
jgi:hypothetical protein